jgi:hypothetical protein
MDVQYRCVLSKQANQAAPDSRVKLKEPRYRPGCGPEGGRGIALLFQDFGARRGWGVSSTPRPHFTQGQDPVPIVQEDGWAPAPVWTGAENLAHTGIRSPDRLARSQSLYRTSYPAHAKFEEKYQINLQESCVLYIGRAYRYPSDVVFYIFFRTNTSTEHFKHAALSPFFSSKCRLFHNATFFGSCIIHILHIGRAKI